MALKMRVFSSGVFIIGTLNTRMFRYGIFKTGAFGTGALNIGKFSSGVLNMRMFSFAIHSVRVLKTETLHWVFWAGPLSVRVFSLGFFWC